MSDYLEPLLLLALLFVGFGLFHGNGKGAGGCAGCTGCADPSECPKRRNRDEADSCR